MLVVGAVRVRGDGDGGGCRGAGRGRFRGCVVVIRVGRRLR